MFHAMAQFHSKPVTVTFHTLLHTASSIRQPSRMLTMPSESAFQFAEQVHSAICLNSILCMRHVSVQVDGVPTHRDLVWHPATQDIVYAVDSNERVATCKLADLKSHVRVRKLCGHGSLLSLCGRCRQEPSNWPSHRLKRVTHY
jgi:hypothetical protein